MVNDEKKDNNVDNGLYVVKQVLYVISREGRPAITPVQVIEEVRRTTIDGTAIAYVVRAAGESEPYTLDNTRDEIFSSPDALRADLVRKATTSIDALIASAVVRANKSFQLQSHDAVTTQSDQTTSDAQELVVVRMPNGEVVNVRMS